MCRPHRPTIAGLGKRRKLPSGVRSGAKPLPKVDFMHIWGQKEATLCTFFSVFLSDSGAPKCHGARETPYFPPLDGPDRDYRERRMGAYCRAGLLSNEV